jgi:hypothetical protein
VSIRDLRRPAPVAEGIGARRIEAAHPYGGGPDGHWAWQEAEAEEDDGRAMAA